MNEFDADLAIQKYENGFYCENNRSVLHDLDVVLYADDIMYDIIEGSNRTISDLTKVYANKPIDDIDRALDIIHDAYLDGDVIKHIMRVEGSGVFNNVFADARDFAETIKASAVTEFVDANVHIIVNNCLARIIDKEDVNINEDQARELIDTVHSISLECDGNVNYKSLKKLAEEIIERSHV